MGAVGLAVLFWPLLAEGLPVGALYALGSAVSWAAGTVYLKWARVDGSPDCDNGLAAGRRHGVAVAIGLGINGAESGLR